jgi:Sec-independent protein translocase protein TatA
MFAFIFDSVSFSEWTVLLVVFLIIMGPRKIPQTARTLGNYYSKLRRAAESFKRQLMDMETEFSKAAAEVESEAKDVEDAFSIDGDESEAIPPSDAYYTGGTDLGQDGSVQDVAESSSGIPSIAASAPDNGGADESEGPKPLYKIKVSSV